MARISVTADDLLAALDEYGKAEIRKPAGPGWYTLEELATAKQSTVPAMAYRLKMARDRGLTVESQPGTKLDAHGKPKRTTYYRLQGKP